MQRDRTRDYHGRRRHVHNRRAQFIPVPGERRPSQGKSFATDDPLIGRRVLLDRIVDQASGCHSNLVEISAGRGPHAYELRCTVCGNHRGWLPKAAADFLREAIRTFGAPQTPPTWRDTGGMP